MRKDTRIQYQKDMDAALRKYGTNMAQDSETADQALDRLAAKGDKGVAMAYDSLVADPMIKSHGEVTKAADVLDAYVRSQLRKNETMEAGHDRLADSGDDRYGELYEAVTAYRG